MKTGVSFLLKKCVFILILGVDNTILKLYNTISRKGTGKNEEGKHDDEGRSDQEHRIHGERPD